MANFIGYVRGNRGEASRLGHSRLTTRAASWQGAVAVELYTRDGIDYARVSLTQHKGAGCIRQLYDGPVDGNPADARRPIIDDRHNLDGRTDGVILSLFKPLDAQ